MPNIFIYWLEGKTKEQKKKVVEEFTKTMVNIGVPKDAVSIGFIETTSENFAKGGVLRSEVKK